jgi:hypothetical protein
MDGCSLNPSDEGFSIRCTVDFGSASITARQNVHSVEVLPYERKSASLASSGGVYCKRTYLWMAHSLALQDLSNGTFL